MIGVLARWLKQGPNRVNRALTSDFAPCDSGGWNSRDGAYQVLAGALKDADDKLPQAGRATAFRWVMWARRRPAAPSGWWRCMALRTAAGVERQAKARHIALPVDGRGRRHERLRVQRARLVGLRGARVGVQSVVAHGVASRFGDVLQQAGEEALGRQREGAAALAGTGLGVRAVAKRHLRVSVRRIPS